MQLLSPVIDSQLQVGSESPACEQRRWYSIVKALATRDQLGIGELQQLLTEAIFAVRADKHWASSGIMELLVRARDSASSGFAASAKKAAIGLLDFHLVVEKYRTATRSTSGEDKVLQRSSSSEDDEHITESACCDCCMIPCDDNRGALPSSNAQEDQPNQQTGSAAHRRDAAAASCEECFRKPAPVVVSGDCRRKRTPSFADHDAPAKFSRNQAPATCWSGPIQLRKGEKTIDLCSVDIMLPAAVTPELPERLSVRFIRPRRGIVTKGQLACATTIQAATPHQLSQLQHMAQLELVAMIPMQDGCAAILVPYMSKTRGLVMVTFIAELAC